MSVMTNYDVKFNCFDAYVLNVFLLDTIQCIRAFVDPTPTCGVTTSGPIVQGQNVTLSCSMTYYCKSPEARLIPGAGISASIGWQSEAGVLLSNNSTDETVTGGKVVGETLQVSVTKLASGSEIPSYNCTSAFQFTDKADNLFTYATNSLAWTCISSPVLVWCTYLSVVLSRSRIHEGLTYELNLRSS